MVVELQAVVERWEPGVGHGCGAALVELLDRRLSITAPLEPGTVRGPAPAGG